MKKFTLLLLFTILLQAAHSDRWVSLSSPDPSPVVVTLESSSITASVVRFTLEGFLMQEVTTPRGPAFIITVDNGTPLLDSGAPDLAKLTASLIIPDKDAMTVEVLSSRYQEYKDIEVAPSKGNLTRDIDPSTVPYVYAKAYETDAFYPGVLAALRDPYILRDYRGQAVLVYPFQYDPVTKTLRVYSEITVRLYSTGADGTNPLRRRGALIHVDRDFNTLYEDHFLNAGNTRYTPVEEEGRMVIISYGDFIGSIQPFVDWKRQSGRQVEVVDVADIGNSSDIKAYLQDYYDTWGPAYCLLVGDAAQVPPSYNSGDSDNDYTYVAGNDHYPDFFIGRFSAEDASQVTIQVERTLEYEKNPSTTFDWFTRCTGIGSDQGPGDDNEYDYEHVRNMQSDLMNYTYTYNAELFDGSQGGNDDPGNPTPSMVSNEVNTGSSVILYTGHGSETAWSTSGFSNTDVNNLVNFGKYPFIWSVACVNGNFVNFTCFAEAWLRANQDGQPTGAVATLMSTINQSWNPPMEGQDEMVDILVESYSDNIKRTFGGLSMNGCMKMNDTYGNDGYQMTDTWTVFGDPSVMVRTAMPLPLTVDYANPVSLGTTQLTVTSGTPEGVACLSFQGQILATAYLTGGTATLTFDPLNSLDDLTMTVTSYNHIPYIGTLTVVGVPGQPVNPFPAMDQGNIDPFVKLTWDDGAGGVPEVYIFYMGTDNPPTNMVNGDTLYSRQYNPPGNLDYLTKYYWRVDAINQYGSATGTVWAFTTVRPPDEDFETGDFSQHGWSFGGDAAWNIDDTDPFNGLYCARSGVIGDNQSSSLMLQLDVDAIFTVPISFYKKVKCAIGDKLQFIIDGNPAGEWTGLSPYTKVTFMISAGLHTLEWKYIKDGSGSSGDDCVQIDYIFFPPLSDPSVYAGEDAAICEGLDYGLSGQAVNYVTLLWTTSGTGTFDDPTVTDPVYFPSSDDYNAGSVTLTLTLYTPSQTVSDDMVLTFNPLPGIPSTPSGPYYVDLYYTATSAYSSEGAADATSYHWLLEPEEAGTLDTDGTACTVNWNPAYLGEASLSLQGINDCGEGPFSEALTITVDNTVGIDKTEGMTVRILPNPTNSIFDLVILPDKNQQVDIGLFDMTGHRIMAENNVSTGIQVRKTFDLAGYHKGIYFLVIRGDDVNIIRKVVLQ